MTISIRGLWEKSTSAEFLTAMARGEVPVPPHSADVGLVVASASPGRVELLWRPPPRLANPAGIVHGGYVAMALDDAAGLSAASLADRFQPMLTLELHIYFVRGVRPGETYRAIGEVVHAGKARILADARLVQSDDKLIARASGSFTPNAASIMRDDLSFGSNG
jgi:uncharacterized protein (TIGR00369 family)